MEIQTYAVTMYLRGRTYYASYQLPGQRKVGKSLKTGNRQDAELKRAALEADINEAHVATQAAAPATNGITFRQLADKHLEYQRGECEKSYRPVANVVENLMVPYFADARVSEITLEDLNGWKFKQRDRGLKNGTMRFYLKRLRAIFNYAVKHGHIADSPAKHVTMPKAPKKKDYRDKVLARADLKALCKASSPYYASVWELLANTGMRPNELRQLRHRDVVDGSLDLPGTITKTGEPRTVPLNPTAREALKYLTIDARVDALYDGKEFELSPGDLIMRDTYGTGTISRAFKCAAKKAGLGKHVLYNLRHTFISTLVNNGVVVPTVSEIAGHDKLETTMAYIHIQPGAARTAVEGLSLSAD